MENVIEWLRDSKTATLTICQGRYKSKIEKLAEQYPDEVQILQRNEDGSILVKVPTNYIKISRPKQVSEEQRIESARRLAFYRSNVDKE